MTLRLSSLTVSAVVHFDHEAKLCRVTAHRHIEEGGRFLLREWYGHFSEYRRIGGMLIPMKASATWHLESGDLEYFRGEITEIEHDV